MISIRRLILGLGLLLLVACQQAKRAIITIQDGGQTYSVPTKMRQAGEVLNRVGISLGAKDRLLCDGTTITLETILPEIEPCILIVRRAFYIDVITPEAKRSIETSALSIGQALAENGFQLYVSDRVSPAIDTPLMKGMIITYQPARDLVVVVDGEEIPIRSAAGSVGIALAEAGIPLISLDYSIPSEESVLPTDGRIQVVRVVERVTLTQKSIPFEIRTELSANVEIDHQELIQGGENGLAIARLRTRSEDGVQVSQINEEELMVRPPKDQVTGVGTKIVVRSEVVDGVSIEYWRKLTLYATSYSPCRLGVPGCSTGTASGLTAQKGVVAMVYSWYLAFGFEHLYIPGYGFAVVGDVGGGAANSHYWIDLGYSDADWIPWSEYVTVYFLTPIPADPVYVLP